MKTVYICRICDKLVRNNTRAIFCDSCKSWVHPRCNMLSSADFDSLSNSNVNEAWLCLKCISETLPFCSDQTPETPNPNFENSFYSKLNSSLEDCSFNSSDDEPFGTTQCKYYDTKDFNFLFSDNTV